MRRSMLLVISVMPLMAMAPQGPVSARISRASVLFGPGIIKDRSGETPAPAFKPKLNGSLQLEGLNARTTPRFRFWLVKAGDEGRLKRASPGSVKAKALAVVPAATGIKAENGYSFEVHWPKGAVEPEDRLFVEVFLGRRRAATAISPIQSLFLPASRPRDNEEKS
ncbi:MAG: hypothetical protein IPQ13_02025 [Holophagaceae bacterium]|nr:hypothetical protein [Holophagaceae bacterium]